MWSDARVNDTEKRSIESAFTTMLQPGAGTVGGKSLAEGVALFHLSTCLTLKEMMSKEHTENSVHPRW